MHYAAWAFGLWLGQLFLAIYSSTVANLIFSIPFGSVVDVELSLAIFLPITIVVIYVIISWLYDDFSDWLSFVLTTIAYALTPFAAIIGYAIYAFLGGMQLAEASPMYQAYMAHVRDLLNFVAHVGARLSIPQMEFIGTQGFFNWSYWIFGLYGPLHALIAWGFRRRER